MPRPPSMTAFQSARGFLDYFEDVLSGERLAVAQLLEGRHQVFLRRIRDEISCEDILRSARSCESALSKQTARSQQMTPNTARSGGYLEAMQPAAAGDLAPFAEELVKGRGDLADPPINPRDVHFPEREVDVVDSGAPMPSHNAGAIGHEEDFLQDTIADSHTARGIRQITAIHHSLTHDAAVDTRCWLDKLVSGTAFEMVFAFLIVLNTLSMCAEAEYRGWKTGNSLQIEGLPGSTKAADTMFEIIEVAFGSVFTLEVVLKMMAERCQFWISGWNLFDLTIICMAWANMVYSMDFLPISPMVLRLVRLVRLLRLAGSLKQYEIFDNLNLMVRGIKAATPVLVWVFALLFPLLSSFALGLNYTLADFIKDESKPLTARTTCYNYWGTFSKAFLSMFEITFASWVPMCRFLHSNVGEQFALFFMAYRLVVGIAVLRIVYGVFLHVTFACASNDDEQLIAQKKRKMKAFTEKMHAIFMHIDTSGDGQISREEFREVCKDKHLQTWLASHELEIRDADHIFEMTDDGNGLITASEMVHAFSRMQGAARSIDVLTLLSLFRKSQGQTAAVA